MKRRNFLQKAGALIGGALGLSKTGIAGLLEPAQPAPLPFPTQQHPITPSILPSSRILTNAWVGGSSSQPVGFAWEDGLLSSLPHGTTWSRRFLYGKGITPIIPSVRWYAMCERPSGECIRVYRVFLRGKPDTDVFNDDDFTVEYITSGGLFDFFTKLINPHSVSNERGRATFHVTGISTPRKHNHEVVLLVETAKQSYLRDGDDYHKVNTANTSFAVYNDTNRLVRTFPLEKYLHDHEFVKAMQEQGIAVLYTESIAIPAPPVHGKIEEYPTTPLWSTMEVRERDYGYWYTSQSWNFPNIENMFESDFPIRPTLFRRR